MTNWIRKLIGQAPRPAADPLEGLAPEARDLIVQVRAKNLTYLSERKLASLAQACRALEAGGVPGLFIEAGCALGGSSILLARLKQADRPMRVYDVFGMIPAPTGDDPPEVHERYRTIREGQSQGLGGERYYGYEDDLYGLVQANLAAFGIDRARQQVELIKGLLQDTMVIDAPVALAHVDVDWYDPVKTCLERIVPKLSVGGVVVLDDYHDWGGCRKAADEYFQGRRDAFAMDDSARSMKITRLRA
jgi:asparagine synthase (glutamine-hydrolysing)